MRMTTTPSDVALVTGASGGFGTMIVKTLAAAGIRVFAGIRDHEDRNLPAATALRAWAGAEGHHLEIVDLDVTSDVSVRSAIAAVTARAGHIDIVVNNAGIAGAGPLEAFSIDQVRAIFDTNVFGPLRVDKAVLPGMRERRSGLLMYISSTLGRVLPGLGGPYPASKWALEGLADGLGNQVADFGIDVVIVEPGAYPTEALARGIQPTERSVLHDYVRLARPPADADYGDPPPEPQEVADAVLAAIRTSSGRRPRRVVVGSVLTRGVDAYNSAHDVARQTLIGSMQDADHDAPGAGGADATENQFRHDRRG